MPCQLPPPRSCLACWLEVRDGEGWCKRGLKGVVILIGGRNKEKKSRKNTGLTWSNPKLKVGFEMVDAIAEAEGISMNSVSFRALFGKGYIGKVPVMLSKPQTFMNLSGESVGPMVSYYKIPLKQVLLIYDDLDLPFGKLRLLPKGGHGGQNGMRSVINHFKGISDFPRLRIGIGRPPGKMDPASYVLRAFNKQERQELDFAMQKGVEAVRKLVLEGFDKSASFVNSPKPLERLS